MITLTEGAASQIKRVFEQNNMPEESFLRLGIKGGGCAGFTYVFDFDDKKDEFDREFESNGVKVVVDRKSLLYIDGTEVDYKTSLMESGFRFNNPKADASCGCGTSFVPKDKPLF